MSPVFDEETTGRKLEGAWDKQEQDSGASA